MYSITIPPEYLGDLCNIREETNTSIRKQILRAIRSDIKKFRKKEQKHTNFK